MESIYTTSVNNVPADYNEPTQAYKKHVWIAVLGIVAFFAFYLYLTYWFFFSAYRLLYDVIEGENGGLMPIGMGLASLFLGIFMIKAFFFVQTKYDVQDREIKPDEEPILFDYLYKLADEIGAPRPHKVYLSNRVNACVFYNLSLLDLFFPSKKNLEIGLGLINVLNLGEFKAVLAHEYGHFAQKSMLVGRWVYIANQVANSIISKRDALDTFLSGLSSVDIRIAWIGWLLSIIVWSIRSLVELIFRIVVLSQRALSREMEFQADLVAVSVTGSDALIHALHKLQAADAAFSNALGTVNEQIGQKKAVEDIYAIQSHSIQKTALILNDEEYGKSPIVPQENPENYRVFSDKIAQPPQMWATHPPDQEREANAKQRYIKGEIDDRSAWDLFQNANQTRLILTADLIKTANIETEVIPTSEVLPLHNKQFEKSYFDPKYKGVYLNRFFCQEFQESTDFYRNEITASEANDFIQKLYPESLLEDLEDFTTLKEEVGQLEAIKENRLTASGKNGIWHRGTQIRRKELPKVIDNLQKELEGARLKISDHDRLCRTVNLRLAEQAGKGWDDYVKGLLSVIHYAEHYIFNINDAHRILGQVLTIVMADNKVSSSEMNKLLQACNEVHLVLRNLYEDRKEIYLDEKLLQELNAETWSDCLEKFELGHALEQNINTWIQVIGSWVHSYINSLSILRSEALEVLLQTEDNLQSGQLANSSAIAPVASIIKVDYEVLLPGDERVTDLKLNLWDKFISADGMVASVAKFAVAASIVGGTVYMTGSSGQSDVSVYNGLGLPLTISLNGDEIYLPAHSHKTVDLDYARNYKITTTTQKGELVESFKPDIETTSKHYVYNIARAAALYEYTMYYGGIPGDRHTLHGNKRWMQSRADFILEDAPESISTSGNSTTRDALMAYSDIHPNSIMNLLQEEENQFSLIKSHALWDSKEDKNAIQWIGAATTLTDAEAVLKARLQRYPNEIETARSLMDGGTDAQRAEVCADFTSKSAAMPDNPDLYYIATRCLPDGINQSQGFIEGSKKWPNHGWLNYAASHTYIQQNEWIKGHTALLKSYEKVPGLQESIVQKAERIRRYLATQGQSVNQITNAKNQILDYYISLEEGTAKEPELYVYHLIHTGELQKAMEFRTEKDLKDPSIVALCAVSDGAEKEWITEALQLDPTTVNRFASMLLGALHLREKQDISKFETIFEEFEYGEDIKITDFISEIRAKNYTAAEKIMTQSSLVLQGQLCAFAYVVQNERIPASWKTKAQALLFATEKPFIK